MGLMNEWQPLACSSELVAGQSIVPGFIGGAELALWRSADGRVQAWDNRCPHRSVRLTLGQIVGDSLSCAYHGWQFAANSGQCSGIPAHPETVPPKGLCVKTWSSAEAAGMVWVRAEAASADLPPAAVIPAGWSFCRTLSVRKPLADLAAALQSEGWRPEGQVWIHPQGDARALLLDAQAQLAMAHVWTSHAPGSGGMQSLHAVLRQLRSLAEART